jgi:alpha-methylacyl-CoA racemase
MILADFGAEVVRVDRHDQNEPHVATRAFGRGKRSIKLDLKSDEGRAVFNELCDSSDVVLEGFRPGVMERLKIGPEVLCASNPRLIYARMTGWGQDGSFAHMAGHDINYIASSGALSAFARPGEKPLPPLNLLGDFAGGSLLCAVGILTAVIERGHSGMGQVVDAAMLDGATYLTSFIHMMHGAGMWVHKAGVNLLDTGVSRVHDDPIHHCSNEMISKKLLCFLPLASFPAT